MDPARFADLFLPLLALTGVCVGCLILLGLGLPGVFAASICVWAMGAWPGLSLGFEPWSVAALARLLGVAFMAEALELGVIYLGGRRLKISNRAMTFGMTGGFLGAWVGSPAGPFGAVFSSWLALIVFSMLWLMVFENESFLESIKGGLRALLARLIGLGLKAGVLMGLLIWTGFSFWRNLQLPLKP